MPTTFNVISIGNLADIDTIEGNNTAENASALVGLTFGGPGDPLVDDFVELSRVGNPGSAYDMDNSPNDRFRIDGGAAQTFDATSIYNATITYGDGTTATVTIVLFQDVDGNTYLAPERTANTDQTALEHDVIQSITLDSLVGNTYSGMGSNREAWDYVTCFVRGTLIETADGPVPVEDLKSGDLVRTKDRGFQPLRWVGHRTVPASGDFAPILIRKGALGNTEDLRVSPQHRMLLSGWRAEMYFGVPEALAAAKHLVNDETILQQQGGEVEYYHIMFDQHELVYAAGIESESFNPGQLGWGTLPEASRQEILKLFPQLRKNGIEAYGASVRPALKAHEARALS